MTESNNKLIYSNGCGFMSNGFIRPKYCERFACIAGKCEESCCKAGWEIPIDDETLGLYSSLGGEIGEKFSCSTAEGSDGDIVFKLDENGDCPFLNSDGLCDLYIATDGKLCEICSNYPRFFEEFDGFTESGISISCVEAQRLILAAGSEDYRLEEVKSDDELLKFLVSARQKALDIVFELSPKRALWSLLDYCVFLQDIIDFGDIADFEQIDSYTPPECFEAFDCDPLSSLKKLCGIYLENTDIMYDEWRIALNECNPGRKTVPENELRAYLAYLLYRYFLKAINFEFVISVAMTIAGAYILPFVLQGDFHRLARLHAKETEHDADNFEALNEAFASGLFDYSDLGAIIDNYIE